MPIIIPKTIEQIGKEIRQQKPNIGFYIFFAMEKLEFSIRIIDFHIRQSERRVINEINK
jgi:hypothetical protein